MTASEANATPTGSGYLLAQPQFRRLWLGQVTSQAGIRVYQIAIVWWILQEGGERGGTALGAFLVAGALPALLLHRLMGRVVDRHPPKWLMVGCDLCSSATVAVVAGLLDGGHLRLWHTWGFGFALALIEGFFNPALTKAIPLLVPPRDLERAVAWSASTQYLASFGGAVLGAGLIAWFGIPALVALTALNYLISALIETTLVFPPAAAGTIADAAAPGRTTAERAEVGRDETTDGGGPGGSPAGEAPEDERGDLDWARFPVLRRLLLGFGFANFFATPIFVVLPLYVQKALGAGPSVLWLVESALWIGILTGTFAATAIRSEGRTIRVGAGCMVLLGVCHLAFGVVINAAVLGIGLFGSGLALGVNNVKFITLFQRAVPGAIKGRFFAAMQAIVSFTFPVAYLAFGFLGDHLAANRICILQGLGVLAVAAWFRSLAAHEAGLLAAGDGTGGDDATA